MKTKLLATVSLSLLMGVAATANATDFNYTYVEGSYQDIDADGLDADSYKISGSYAINPKMNILADYEDGSIDNPIGNNDFDFDKTSIGLGYHSGISSKTDFTANVKLIDVSHDLAGDDTGYGLGVGVRHRLTDKIEVGSNIDYVDVNDNGDTTFKLNSRYYLTDKTSLGLSYSTSSDSVDVVSGGIRYDF